jgi:acyl-coenzyme A synthetase/AMP-(fatty) acid ligase
MSSASARSRTRAPEKVFHIGDVFHDAVRRHPDLMIHLDHALRCRAAEDQSLGVRTAAELVDRIADVLEAYGVVPRRPVAIYHHDGFDIPLLASSVARVGGLPVMLSPYLPLETALALIAKLDDPVVLADTEAAERMRPHLGTNITVLVTDPDEALVPGPGTAPVPVSPRRTDYSRTGPYPTDPDAPMLVTHTSGTTRLPKMTMHSARTLWWRVLPQRWVSLLLDRSKPAMFSVTLVHTRFYMALGMFLWRGKPLVIACNPEPEHIAGLLREHRPDYLETHPNTFVDWEKLAEHPDRPLACVKVLQAAFDAIHPRTMRVFLDASGHRRAKFFRFYGQSEVGPATGQYYTKRSVRSSVGQNVGWPLLGFVRVRILDDEGKRVPRGEKGHIVIDSRSRILGYLGDEEAFNRGSRNGGHWWDTGDLGSFDRRRQLILADREIDNIKAVGSSLYYEDVLMESLSSVREAVIIEMGDEPVVLMSVYDGQEPDLGEMRRTVEQIPGVRAAYVVRHEVFPVTATRKIQRPALKVRAAQPGFLEQYATEHIDLREKAR